MDNEAMKMHLEVIMQSDEAKKAVEMVYRGLRIIIDSTEEPDLVIAALLRAVANKFEHEETEKTVN